MELLSLFYEFVLNGLHHQVDTHISRKGITFNMDEKPAPGRSLCGPNTHPLKQVKTILFPDIGRIFFGVLQIDTVDSVQIIVIIAFVKFSEVQAVVASTPVSSTMHLAFISFRTAPRGLTSESETSIGHRILFAMFFENHITMDVFPGIMVSIISLQKSVPFVQRYFER